MTNCFAVFLNLSPYTKPLEKPDQLLGKKHNLPDNLQFAFKVLLYFNPRESAVFGSFSDLILGFINC